MRARSFVAQVVLLAALGCSTRVVDLALPADASPPKAGSVPADAADPHTPACDSRCKEERKPDGQVCVTCFDEKGNQVRQACWYPEGKP